MRRISFLLAGLSLIGGPTMLRADDTPKPPPASAILEMLLKHFDKDADGKLNDEEKLIARENLARHLAPAGATGPAGFGAPDGPPNSAEFLKRFDKDGDGKVNEEEMAAARKVREDSQRKNSTPTPFGNKLPDFVIKRFDKDGDGKLNDQEQADAKEAMAKRGGVPGGNFNREEMIKRFDKDGDGKLGPDEQATARSEMEKRRGDFNLTPGDGKPKDRKLDNEVLLKRFDKDGDGKLNDDERAAALDALKKLNQ